MQLKQNDKINIQESTEPHGMVVESGVEIQHFGLKLPKMTDYS